MVRLDRNDILTLFFLALAALFAGLMLARGHGLIAVWTAYITGWGYGRWSTDRSWSKLLDSVLPPPEED